MAVQIVIELDDNASAGVDKLQGKLKGIDDVPMSGVTASLGNIGAIAGGAALAGVAALGSAFAAFTSKAITDGMAFEAQLDAVNAVLGGSEADMLALKDLAMQLSLSPDLVVDAQGAAEAMEALAASGATTEEILGGAAEASVLLANATGSDFASAAATATDVMSLFNIEAEDMMSAVDGIVSVTDASKFSFTDYQYALAAAGSVAATTGVEFDDLNAAIAAIAPGFASGSDAGTSLKAMLQRLAAPTDEAQALMQQLGVNVYDNEGNFRDMAEVAGELNSAFYGVNEAGQALTEQQRAQALATIFGADAARAAGELAKLTQEDFAAMQTQMADVSALEAASTRVDNLAGDWDIFKGVVDSLALSFYDYLQPGLRVITQWASEFLTTYGPKLIESFGTMSEGIASFFSALREEGLGGDMFSVDGILTAYNEFITYAGELITGGLQWLFDSTKTFFETVDWAAVGTSASNALMAGLTLFVGLEAGLLGLYATIFTWVTNQDWIGLGNSIYTGITTFLTTFWATTMPYFVEWFNSAVAWFREQDWPTIGKNIVTGVYDGIISMTQSVIDAATWFFDTFNAWIVTIDWQSVGFDVMTFLIDGAYLIVTSLTDFVVWLGATIGEYIKTVDWASMGTSLMDGVVAGIMASATNVINAITGILTGAWEAGKAAMGIESPSKVMAAGIGSPMGEGVAVGIQSQAGAVATAMDSLLSGAMATGQGLTVNNSRNLSLNINVNTNSYDLGSNALGAMALYGGV